MIPEPNIGHGSGRPSDSARLRANNPDKQHSQAPETTVLEIAVVTDSPSFFGHLEGNSRCRFTVFKLESDLLFLTEITFPRRFDCLLVDIRTRQQALLTTLAGCSPELPVLVLTDDSVTFEPGYPFNCPVINIIHAAELQNTELTVFSRRVVETIKLFKRPLDLDHRQHPISQAFQQIVDNSSDWIIVKDLEHRFVFVPDMFCETAKHSMSEIIGHNDLEIGSSERDVFGDPESQWAGFWSQDDAVTSTGLTSIEDAPNWQVFNSDIRHKQTYRVPLINAYGNVYALLVCVKDITEQSQNERLLNERTEMLQQVTSEKKKTEEHKDIAESAVEAKNRFLAAASHDLRQPLHAMGLFLDVLNSRLSKEEDLALMSKLKESTSTLYAMFSSLLDISRLDAGVVVPDIVDVDVTTCCSVLESEYRQIASEKGLRFDYDVEPGWARTDPMLCSRIVRNLVDNAFENTQSGSIGLSAHRQDDSIVITVSDTGCGIEADELENIFKEYHKPASKREGPGIGLGLAIVHRLCNLLDIKVAVESVIDQKTRFTLNIPAGKALNTTPAAEPQPPPVENANPDDRQLVLVIDDEETILQGTQSVLDLHGYQAVIANSMDAAFERLAELSKLPDVIVADYELGHERNGIATVNAIRKETGHNIPAILVTGHTSEELKADADSMDCLLLHKPVKALELLAAVRKSGELSKLNP